MVNIVIVSIVSMLSYISAEMIYPLVPLYLTLVLGTTPAIAGLVEGIANSFSALLKFYSGYYADKRQNKRRILIIGYAGAIINHLILMFTNTWTLIMSGRISDRFFKAIRTAPRDAVVSYNAKNKPRAFGLNEAFSAIGATIGIFVAFLIVRNSNDINYKTIFAIAMIPIVLGSILLLFLKEDRSRGLIDVDLNLLSKNLKIFLFIVFFSSLGNSTKVFLILRALTVGFNPANIILLYLIMNLANGLIAYPVGIIVSKINIKKMIIFSYLLFSVVYFGLGAVTNSIVVVILFILYGFYLSFIAVSSRTFVSKESPIDMKATTLGLSASLVGFASLPAAIIFGFLWSVFGPEIAFYFSGVIGFISALGVFVFIKKPISSLVI